MYFVFKEGCVWPKRSDTIDKSNWWFIWWHVQIIFGTDWESEFYKLLLIVTSNVLWLLIEIRADDVRYTLYIFYSFGAAFI